MIIFFFCLIFLMTSLSIPAYAENNGFEITQGTPELIKELRNGGFVIYIRHGKTDTRVLDVYPVVLNDCTKQRPLTEEGREELYLLRHFIKEAQIPVYKIYSSPLCRARESAEILFGKNITVDNNLMYTAQLTSKDKIPIIARTLELISNPIEKEGYNRAMVAHAPNLADIMDYFPDREASTIIFKPLGNGKFNYIATILPEEWEDLLLAL